VADQLATHGGWLVLTSPDESVLALLATGRRLARIWLRAKALNIAIHPMTQVLEEAPGPAGLGQRLGLGAPGLRRKLRRAREPAPAGRVVCAGLRAVCMLRSYCASPRA